MEKSSKNNFFPVIFGKILSSTQSKDSLTVKIIISLILLAAITSMYPYGELTESGINVGSVWAEKDLIAPFSFPIYKDTHAYEKEKQDVSQSVYPIFDRHDAIAQAQIESVTIIVDVLRNMTDARFRWRKSHSKDDSLAFARSVGTLSVSFGNAEWSILDHWHTIEQRTPSQPFRALKQTLSDLLTDCYRIGIIDRGKVHQAPTLVAVRKGTNEEIISSQKIYDLDQAMTAMRNRMIGLFGDNDTVSLAAKIIRISLKPNLIYNEYETNRALQIAQDNVPRTVGFVQENERIVSMHDRITEEIKLKLDSFHRVKADRGAGRSVWSQRLGITLHVALILALFSIYLFLFRKKIFHNNAMLTLIALLLLLETFLGYLSLRLNLEEPIQYLIVIPAASMLLAIIFDSRVAFYGTVTMAFLIAGIRGNDYSIALASLVAGALGAYTVRDIRNRTQIFRSLVFIFIGYFLTIISLGLERYESLNTVINQLTLALANAVISPVLTYGLLIFFERVFSVATDLTLLELSDFNQPLLRQLSEKAPGTFHHSMTIGSLAEAAADAIGANSILARVGAYYHDVGKILKPEYFVENQIGTTNRHNRLRPRMSALIISSHVKEGMDIGREHGLPEKVLDFIPQHHGTTRMSFFYDKALKQAAARKNPKDTINEEDFRYPGPKPQSKETGIVMLADSVEASTRSIVEMTPQKLESSIENMIKQRFVDGQLDECELTLRELTKIKEAFLKILLGIHHQRITYPEQNQLETPVSEPNPVEQPPSIVTEPIVPVISDEPNFDMNVQPPMTESSEENKAQ